MKYIDNFLNRITMYKVVLWGLLILSLVATVFGFLGVLPYGGMSLIYSSLTLFVVCWVSNSFFARVFKVDANVESFAITALILFFILIPLSSFSDIKTFIAVGVIAMASKYLLAIQKKHIWNPAAIALVLAGVFGSGAASWWVGSSVMLIPVAILGFLILRKLRRFELFFVYTCAAILSTLVFFWGDPQSLLNILKISILSGPFIFFGAVMLTEPLTTPPGRNFRLAYGVVVGLLYGAHFELGPIFSTPELALVLGNILAYIVSPRERIILTLDKKNMLSSDVHELILKPDRKIDYKPGQYMEWTLGHSKPDSRGNRRFFTLASSPTEPNLLLGVKSYSDSSTFKQKLFSLEPGNKVVASQLSGDFTMPEDPSRKLVFIAGGIGVTPFRSMVKYMLDKGERRDAVLLFSNKSPADIVYKDVFSQAQNFGLRTLYVVNDLGGATQAPDMRVGMINTEMIMKEIPDFKDREYYISGPHGMVTAFQKTLREIGVPKSHIKTDFFPGFV